MGKKYLGFLTIVALVVGVFYYPNASLVPLARAASLTALSDTMSNQNLSTLSSHTIRFTTPTGASDNTDTIIITFPSDFNFSSKAISSVTFTHGASTGAENTETLAASPSGTAWGAVFSGTQNRIFTLTAPTDGVGAASLAANDKVIITYDSTNSTNASTEGSKTITITGTFGDTGSIAVAIAGGTADDSTVDVTATVDPTITFTNDDAAIGFGTLTTSNAVYATADATGSGSDTTAHTMAIATNAPSGYTLTYNGPTLTSGSNTITPITAGITDDANGTPGTEQFAIGGAMTGTGSMASGYDNGGTADWRFVAGATTTLASHTAPVSNDSIAMHYLGNIAATTEAGAYSTTITYIATGNF
jgi:mucin-22